MAVTEKALKYITPESVKADLSFQMIKKTLEQPSPHWLSLGILAAGVTTLIPKQNNNQSEENITMAGSDASSNGPQSSEMTELLDEDTQNFRKLRNESRDLAKKERAATQGESSYSLWSSVCSAIEDCSVSIKNSNISFYLIKDFYMKIVEYQQKILSEVRILVDDRMCQDNQFFKNKIKGFSLNKFTKIMSENPAVLDEKSHYTASEYFEKIILLVKHHEKVVAYVRGLVDLGKGYDTSGFFDLFEKNENQSFMDVGKKFIFERSIKNHIHTRYHKLCEEQDAEIGYLTKKMQEQYVKGTRCLKSSSQYDDGYKQNHTDNSTQDPNVEMIQMLREPYPIIEKNEVIDYFKAAILRVEHHSRVIVSMEKAIDYNDKLRHEYKAQQQQENDAQSTKNILEIL